MFRLQDAVYFMIYKKYIILCRIATADFATFCLVDHGHLEKVLDVPHSIAATLILCCLAIIVCLSVVSVCQVTYKKNVILKRFILSSSSAQQNYLCQ